jgi:hypothetical protein
MSNSVLGARRRSTLRCVGIAAVCLLVHPLAAQTGPIPDNGYQATVTIEVPHAVDTTEAIAARSVVIAEPFGHRVIPLGYPVQFSGRCGPAFVLQNDPARGLHTNGGGVSPRFPGPVESGLTPGDPNLAVGPNHIVTVINGRISFYTKSGVETFTGGSEDFFSAFGHFDLVYDCRTFYDQYSQRYWLQYAAFDTLFPRTYYLIAVSDDDDPNGNWSMWALNSTKNGPFEGGHWSDYPGFGYTEDCILISSNMFPWDRPGYYAKVRIAPKQQFLDNESVITYTDFWNFANPDGTLAFSLQPSRQIGENKMPYFANESSGNQISIFGIEDATSPNPRMVKRAVTVSRYNSPNGATQKGSSTKLDTIDARVYDVYCRDDRLIVTHTVRGGGGGISRWYELDATNMPDDLSLVQSGEISAGNASCWFAGPAQNGQGSIGIVFSRASVDEYPSVYYAGREASDPAGTLGEHVLVLAGTRSYTGEGSATVRWGDYFGCTVDAVDDFTFWGFLMYPYPYDGRFWVTEVFSFTIGELTSLSGVVSLPGYEDPAGLAAEIEFRTPGTTDVVYAYPIVLEADGSYDAGNVASGTFDVAVKFSHWLRQVRPSVTFDGAETVDFTPINGDALPDNRVDLEDLTQVLAFFSQANDQADLNGSGVVDLPDLSLVLANIGKVGDD